MSDNLKNNENISLLSVLRSVLSAFFGVQSSARHKRDFEKGNIMHFVYAGSFLTVVFILVIFGIVQLVLYFLM